MAQEEAEPSIYDTSGATGVRQPVCLCFCIGFICHSRANSHPKKGGGWTWHRKRTEAG